MYVGLVRHSLTVALKWVFDIDYCFRSTSTTTAIPIKVATTITKVASTTIIINVATTITRTLINVATTITKTLIKVATTTTAA